VVHLVKPGIILPVFQNGIPAVQDVENRQDGLLQLANYVSGNLLGTFPQPVGDVFALCAETQGCADVALVFLVVFFKGQGRSEGFFLTFRHPNAQVNP
jgi:hypothetical protein